MNRGKSVIIAIVLVGLGLSTFAWWHRWTRSQQVLEHWGEQAAIVIRNGKSVELLRLTPRVSGAADIRPQDGTNAASRPAELNIAGATYAVEATDISDAAGLIHARHHLLHEQGFVWDEPRDPAQLATWTVALRFQQGNTTATMALDFAAQRARLVERDVEVSMEPIAPALQTFINELMLTGDADRPASPASSQSQRPRRDRPHGPIPRSRPTSA